MKKFKHKITGEIITYKDGVMKVKNLCIEAEPNLNFWEDITNIGNEYEVLEYTIGKYGSITINPDWTASEYYIHKIKRLCDSEIFTIGDKVVTPSGQKFIISEFYMDCNDEHLLCNGEKTGAGHINITKIKKLNHLFKTLDGVDIFNGDDYFSVNIKDLKVNKNHQLDLSNLNDWRIFSTESAAKEFIILNKKSLSLNDIILSEIHNGNSDFKNGDMFLRLKKIVILDFV
jgi:hypothetical protein